MGLVVQAATSRERQLLAVLLDFNQQISQGAAVDDLLHEIAEVARMLSKASACWLVLLHQDGSPGRQAASGLLFGDAERITSGLIAGGALQTVTGEAESLRVEDLQQDPLLSPLSHQMCGFRSLCFVPMRSRNGVVGLVAAASEDIGHFDGEDEQFLGYLAAAIARDVDNTRLYQMAITDPLTGAFNRQYLADRLPAEIERHRRYGEPLSVVAIDVDHFKHVNDTWGHPAGDRVLQQLTDRLSAHIRDVDSLIRYGGEEFLLILPCTDLDGASLLANRLCDEVAQHPMTISADTTYELTVSGGVAEWDTRDLDAASLVARADALLYQAKAAGRNRILCAPHPLRRVVTGPTRRTAEAD